MTTQSTWKPLQFNSLAYLLLKCRQVKLIIALDCLLIITTETTVSNSNLFTETSISAYPTLSGSAEAIPAKGKMCIYVVGLENVTVTYLQHAMALTRHCWVLLWQRL